MCFVSEPVLPTNYEQLVQQSSPVSLPCANTAETELDSLIRLMEERGKTPRAVGSDPLHRLRELTVSEFVPVFVELVEKYSASGISMQMDASNFLEGGREIRFEFGLGDYRFQLHGTVTTEGIAFHETRYCPDLHGELTTGPMLRVRGLDGKMFREFICERLTHLIRTAMRRR